jgi:hypothetical protein
MRRAMFIRGRGDVDLSSNSKMLESLLERPKRLHCAPAGIKPQPTTSRTQLPVPGPLQYIPKIWQILIQSAQYLRKHSLPQFPHRLSLETWGNGLNLIMLPEPAMNGLALRRSTKYSMCTLNRAPHKQENEQVRQDEDAWEVMITPEIRDDPSYNRCSKLA